MSLIRVATYTRVSTEEQKKYGYSISAQAEVLNEYIEKNKNFILVDHFVDEGFSAGSLKRPALKSLLSRLDEIDLILFTKLDRWWRDVYQYYKIQEILDRNHVKWNAVLEDYNTDTADGVLKVDIMLAVAKNERERGSERIKQVLEYKIKHGQAINGSVPKGYMLKKVDNYSIVVKNPETERLAIAMINDLETHNSYSHTSRMVEEIFGVYMVPLTIKRFIRSPLLRGEYRGNKDYCEPYLTAERQARIVERLKSNIKERKNNYIYIFTSLIVCPLCQKNLIGLTYKRIAHNTIYYRCHEKYTRRRCNVALTTIQESIIERQLLDMIVDEFTKYELEFTTKAKSVKPKVDSKKLEAELERLNTMFQKGRMQEAKYDEEYDRISRLLATPKANTNMPKLQTIFNNDFESLYLTLNAENKRAFWQGILKHILIDEYGNITDVIFL